jgi:two-component system, sensor histidine kinase PdtaS
MPTKSKMEIRLCGLRGRVLFSLCILLPSPSFAQKSKLDIASQRLLLKLGSCYLNVAKQNQIDIDSGLALASQRSHLSIASVIEEDDDNFFRDPANKAVAGADIDGVRKLIVSAGGLRKMQLQNWVGGYFAFQPGGKKRDLDSAMAYLTIARKAAENSRNNHLLIRNLSYLGKYLLKSGDPSKADSIFTQSIDLSVRSGDKAGEAMAWCYWGTYSQFLPNTILDRIQRLRKADTLYEQLNNKQNQIANLTNIGYLSFAANKLADSKHSFTQALALENAIHFPFTHYTVDMLALISELTGDHENELKFAMAEVKTAEATGDSIALAYIYSRRSNADFGNTSNRESELDWALKSLNEFKRLGGDPQLYPEASNIALIFSAQGKDQEVVTFLNGLLKQYPPDNVIDESNAYLTLGAAYSGLGNLAEAENYLLKAEQLHQKTAGIRGNIGSFELYFSLGQLYLKKGEFEKSRSYLNTALTYPNTNTFGQYAALIEKYFSTIDSAAGQFKNAFVHSQRYNDLEDSIRKKDNVQEVAELRAKYEIDKKDNNIKILNQQASLQEAKNRQNVFTRNVTIGGAVVLMLFLALLYNRYRTKKKSNEKLEEQKNEIGQKNAVLQHLVSEKEWLIKEVHHRVKNNLHTVICLLESQARHLENDALKAIEVSQHRIYAMSLIHQKLYQSEDIKTIDMASYVPELVRYLDTSFGVTDKIGFQLDIEPIKLSVAQAIPVGLIINEAVTNSIKHAFRDEQRGLICIDMQQKIDTINLTIADNGIGMDPAIAGKGGAAMGLKLINGLVEDLNGEVRFADVAGTKITIHFSADELADGHHALVIEKERT